MKAIRVQATGGPDVLRQADLPDPRPARGEALVRVAVAGVNFIDVYHRTGLYRKELPFIPGVEGAGVVEAVAEDVAGVSPGDRVAWAMHPGSYAELATVPAWRLVRLTERVSFEVGATLMTQGMTAHYLARSTYALGPEDVAVVHAAAGGVGLLLVQIAARLGATVIGTCSTEEKAALARAAGARHVIRYTETPFQPEVMRLTEGEGASVVYDSVGRTTFRDSLASLRPRGLLALFGQSSGKVEPFDPGELASGGSLFLTRPSLADYTRDAAEVEWRGRELMASVEAGELDVRIHDVLPLEEAPRAHAMLEGRETAGKLLLRP